MTPQTTHLSTYSGYPWYALRVKTHFERRVAVSLASFDYETFAAVYSRRVRWSDRFKIREAPLFPGYVFVRLDIARRLPVLMVPGVLGFVSFSGSILPVERSQLESVQAMTRAGKNVEPWPTLSVGDAVRVIRGPLAGVEGTLLTTKGHYRLIVSVTLLQRAVSAEVDIDCVERIARAEHRRCTAVPARSSR